VASLPRINRLHEAMRGEPVVFIAVTDEPAGKIAAFMKTHEIKAWVGIDRAKSSIGAYRVKGRPDGYLIGRDGALLARVSPETVSEKDLRAAIAGKFEPQPVEWADAAAAAPPGAEKPLFEIKVSAAQGKPRMSSSSDGLELRAVSFASGLAYIWDAQYDQVILDTKPVDSFNALLKTPPDGIGPGREALKAAIQSAFGIRVAPEQRETEVYVLALSTEPGAPRPKPGAPDAHAGLLSYGGGRLLGTDEMPGIARAIWMGVDKPVVDETGLKGAYEFDLEWTYGNADEAGRLLAGHGLVLVPARRQIEFLRVTPGKP